MHGIVLDRDRSIHSIKTALAVLIAFAITKTIHLPVEQWLIITVIVVMCAQVNVGSVLQKSYMRFLGTVVGSIVSLFTIITIGAQPLVVGTVMTISVMVFSYLATSQTKINEAGTLGAATTAIILVGQTPTISNAIGRFLEITGGIILAALVSQFILPIHARNLLRRNQAKTLRQLSAYYLDVLATHEEKTNPPHYYGMDIDITNSILAQRKLAIEAAREPFAKRSRTVNQFNKSLWCEREILRAITFMQHAYKSCIHCRNIFSTPTILHDFHDKICIALQNIANFLEKKPAKKLSIDIPSIDVIKNITLPDGLHLTTDDRIYTNAYLFCAEIIVKRLKELVDIIK